MKMAEIKILEGVKKDRLGRTLICDERVIGDIVEVNAENTEPPKYVKAVVIDILD